jgi:hypothetical protein
MADYPEQTEEEIALKVAHYMAHVGRQQAPTIQNALRLAGWLPWVSGPCPVDPLSFPIVLTASGDTDCERATEFQWQWNDDYPGDNVIAYKVLE